MNYVWEYFLQLNRKRSSNGFSVNPISYTEMLSYFELNKICVSPEEIRLIDMLDIIMLEHHAEESEKQQAKKRRPRIIKVISFIW